MGQILTHASTSHNTRILSFAPAWAYLPGFILLYRLKKLSKLKKYSKNLHGSFTFTEIYV